MYRVHQAKISSGGVYTGVRVIPFNEIKLYCVGFSPRHIPVLAFALPLLWFLGVSLLANYFWSAGHTLLSGVIGFLIFGIGFWPLNSLMSRLSRCVTIWTDTEHLHCWTSEYKAETISAALKNASIPESALHDLPATVKIQSPDEKVECVIREVCAFAKTAGVCAIPLLLLLFASFAAGLLAVASGLYYRAFPEWWTLPIIGFVAFLAGSVFLGLVFGIVNIPWYFSCVVLTNRRLIVRRGIFSTKQEEYLRESLLKIDILEPLFDRIFRFGTIIAHTIDGPRRIGKFESPGEFRSRFL